MEKTTDGSRSIAFTPDGGHLAVVRNDGPLELWRLPGAEPIPEPEIDIKEPPPLSGDVLFDTAQSNLKASSSNHLANLSAFLKAYPERGVIIEGHTDSVGHEDYNFGLSQRRADSVRSYLLGQGIAASRMTTAGKGESLPIAGNDSASGRQQNRRVEVIITDAMTASK
jgi:outer membrane protein OmpA-like peptidoglycan-associated protein